MKLVLMGTNAFVVPIFDAIKSAGHEILAVFTRAPKPVGRKQILTPSPVYIWAEQNGLNVHTNIKEYNYSPDMIVVISYGVILRDNVLSSAPCINIHPSLLPKYRGPSPIRTAIYNGDTQSGVCLMQVTPELDAGDIYMCQK
ncbi:MAG: methionyl-tRNA formyltransferase, partial [Alphaproteobacteria bacterium]|nr:methionyl-tRNA formyltransferase [Alphaproteobacteria bacterium]